MFEILVHTLTVVIYCWTLRNMNNHDPFIFDRGPPGSSRAERSKLIIN